MTRDRGLIRDRNVERVLEHWFTDGVNEMPDRVYQSILDRVERQPQALAPRLLRRLPEMNGSLRWIAAAAAVLLIAVIGVAVLGRTTDSGLGGPAATPSPSPSASPSPANAWDSPTGPCGETGCGGPLVAGTYTSTGLKPAVTYTLTSPWVNQRDWAQFFLLYLDTPANRAVAASGGYPPYILVLPGPTMVSASASCDHPAADGVAVDATGFAEFLASRNGLTVRPPIPVTVSALSGIQVDVIPDRGWNGCLPGTPIGETARSGETYRFIVLDQPDGGSLMIRLRASSDFDSFVTAAMPVVESFQFDVTQQPSPSP